MTFAKVLKGTISRKRKAVELAEKLANEDGVGSGRPKKYLRRGDIEVAEDIASGAPGCDAEQPNDSGVRYESGSVSGSGTWASGHDQEGGDAKSHGGTNEHVFTDIAADEVVRRLRAKCQPIRFFGETDDQRIQRLRNLETMEEKTGHGGQRNDFMAALNATNTGLTLELLRNRMGQQDDKTNQATPKPKKKPKHDLDTSEISMQLLQTNPDKNSVLIYVYFKRLLKEWEEDLGNRLERVKRSTQGKLEAAKQKQTVQYLQPFFKQLKSKQIPDDVMARITEITSWMQKREYVQANDAYLRLSIGNAPWPIGVTMVGIHERSAREKIFSAQVAHVLNDEVQRKWIQSVKRLMTFVQNKYPPDDLAKCVG